MPYGGGRNVLMFTEDRNRHEKQMLEVNLGKAAVRGQGAEIDKI